MTPTQQTGAKATLGEAQEGLAFRGYRAKTGAKATPVWVPKRTNSSGVVAATI